MGNTGLQKPPAGHADALGTDNKMIEHPYTDQA